MSDDDPSHALDCVLSIEQFCKLIIFLYTLVDKQVISEIFNHHAFLLVSFPLSLRVLAGKLSHMFYYSIYYY